MKIAAGIVLFHPDKERFLTCLQIILKQFDVVIVFDNVGDQKDLFCCYERVTYLTECENKGIAYALNRIMERARSIQCEWVVTLDQDTMIPENLASSFKKYITMDKVAIIAPQVIDKRRPYMKLNETDEDLSDVELCITSASCTNVSIWNELGRFDELLFIDFVDNDYCKRVKAAGYRILKYNKLVIDQEFGNITLKPQWKAKFYLWLSKVMHNENIAKLSYKKKEVNPSRVYYVHRNLLYLNEKYKESGGIGYQNFKCKGFLGFLLYFTLPSIVRGKQKMQLIKAVIKGFCDGYQLAKNIRSEAV